jgi:hypothetical protein
MAGNLALIGAVGWPTLWTRDSGGVWTLSQSLVSEQYPTNYHFLGQTLGLRGGRAIVGDAEHQAAYVFEPDAGGVWVQSATLLPQDVTGFFGGAVAIDGDVAVVGAEDDFDLGNYAGAAFVFERDAKGVWQKTAKLLPHDGRGFWQFGHSVALHGITALIGAYTAGAASPNGGAAYVFERDPNGAWRETAQLINDDNGNSDAFSASLALEGELALIGAYGHSAVAPSAGAAYVFWRGAGGAWTQLAKLTAPDGQELDRFGLRVALCGDTALIGAPDDDDNGEDSGSAYVFRVGPDLNGNGVMDVCEPPLILNPPRVPGPAGPKSSAGPPGEAVP